MKVKIRLNLVHISKNIFLLQEDQEAKDEILFDIYAKDVVDTISFLYGII
jgi:hypothetical protein